MLLYVTFGVCHVSTYRHTFSSSSSPLQHPSFIEFVTKHTISHSFAFLLLLLILNLSLQIMEIRSLLVSMNPNFSSFELSRPVSPVTRSLLPFKSAKLRPHSVSRVSASISTPNSETPYSDTDKISVKPVYVPTPPNRELRTPHSG